MTHRSFRPPSRRLKRPRVVGPGPAPGRCPPARAPVKSFGNWTRQFGRGIGRRNRPLSPRLIMAVAAVGLFIVSYQWGSQYKHGGALQPALSGIVIRPSLPLPDLVLTDSSGGPFGRADLIGYWSLLVFAASDDAQGRRGIARLVDVYNRLADQPDLQQRLRLLLVGTDAQPRLALDFERLSPAIAVLSAEPATLEALEAALGADPQAKNNGLPPLFLIDSDARLAALFPASQLAAEVAADVAALAD